MFQEKPLVIDRKVTHRIASEAEAIRTAGALANDFAQGAAERDRTRRLPDVEIERFSASGLWAIGVPQRFGGIGASYRTIAKVIETISAADPSIGQIPQNHLSVAFLLQSVGSEEQQRHFFDLILGGTRFGNALAEMTRKTAHDFETRFTRSRRDGVDGWEINGRKFYSTGALFADFVSVGASDAEGRRLTAIVPRGSPGLAVVDDWSSFGQRTTASGTVTLEQVFGSDFEVIETWRTRDQPVANGPVAQIIQAAIDSGIAVAAVEDTKTLVRDVARPWRDAGVDRAADEPFTLAMVGRLEIALHASQAMLERAAYAVDHAIAEPGERSVAEASVAVAEAKVLTTEIALEASSKLFELAGTRATLEPNAYDRHWRNARVHTLHDPVRWKYAVVGDWALNGRAPPRHGLV